VDIVANKKKENKTTKTNNKKVKNNEIVEVKTRKIPVNNYFILCVIFLLTFALVFGLRNWYISYRDYRLTIPVLKDKLTEVTISELDTYIAENTDAIIYIEVSEDENSREVAKDLYEVVKKRNLTNRVVYVNLSSTNDKDKLLKDFSNKYTKDQKIEYYPALVLFLDGKIEAFVSKKESQNLNIGDIEQLFDEYELEGEH